MRNNLVKVMVKTILPAMVLLCGHTASSQSGTATEEKINRLLRQLTL